MTTSLVSEDALWRSLPHIWLLEKWWPLPDLDLAIIVKQILSSTTYWECYGGFLHTMTSSRPPAGLDVVFPSLPAPWNFISLACVFIFSFCIPTSSPISCWLCFQCPCLALFSVHPFLDELTFFTSFSILQTPVAPGPISEPQLPKLCQFPTGQSTPCPVGQLSKIQLKMKDAKLLSHFSHVRLCATP